ncbi:response regulator [Pseudomonas sp. NPDC098747]|uniref:response regulator n=1 Tax=Pseudomonas sp. NPDC098747 TaxID=3364487 RepID=UPI00383BA3A4
MSLTVLVVEDDEILRSIVVEAVLLLGFRVLDCASADEALVILVNSSAVALVITDVCMPGSMDGLELAKVIWTRWPSLPVIITSGNRIMPDGLLPAHAMFLRKPWTLDVLHCAIRVYLHA